MRSWRYPASQNSDPEMGPFLGPVESVPILKGPKNGSEIRTRFWPRFSHKLALSSELFNLEIRNKTAENKSLGKVMTSYAELQQAAVADEQVGNNDRQQKLCSCAFTSPTSEEGTPALWRPLPWQCFRAVFNPPKPALNLAGCCHPRPIHISELLQLASRS